MGTRLFVGEKISDVVKEREQALKQKAARLTQRDLDGDATGRGIYNAVKLPDAPAPGEARRDTAAGSELYLYLIPFTGEASIFTYAPETPETPPPWGAAEVAGQEIHRSFTPAEFKAPEQEVPPALAAYLAYLMHTLKHLQESIDAGNAYLERKAGEYATSRRIDLESEAGKTTAELGKVG